MTSFTALKLNRLAPFVSPLSSQPTGVSAEITLPLYTHRIVSKLLPPVRNVTVPLVTAVHLNQMELVALKPLLGSPVSPVAPLLAPVTVPTAPDKMVAALKLSLGGGGPGV